MGQQSDLSLQSDLDLANELLAAAALGRVRTIEPVSQRSITNVILLVTTSQGGQYVYKRFTWPYAAPDVLERRVKESYLHELLRDHGVPVPRIITSARLHGNDVHLMEFVPGFVLGELAREPAARPALRTAWRQVGATMARIHGIRLGSEAGVISGAKVQPFAEGSWGQWFSADLRKHALNVARQLPDEVVGQLIEVADLTAVATELRQPVLLHNDPHPWNVIVARTALDFELAGWLDWEFAWCGDRWWDMARMSIFRFADIGHIPDDLDLGYGARRTRYLRFDLYYCGISLWMFGQYLDGDDQLPDTYRMVREYVRRLPAELPVLLNRLRQTAGPLPVI